MPCDAGPSYEDSSLRDELDTTTRYLCAVLKELELKHGDTLNQILPDLTEGKKISRWWDRHKQIDSDRIAK